jgi:hypothetical protein
LPSLECDSLSFAKIVEASFTARRVMEEVLVPVSGQDETEPFVTDEPFDRAVHERQCEISLQSMLMMNAL